MSQVIWYLHPYAGSPDLGMAYRPYYLCQEFRRMGHKPWIITASYHHLLRSPRNIVGSFCQEIIDNTPYIWLKTNRYKGNGLGRLRNMLAYGRRLKHQAKAITQLSGKPDVMIVSSAHPFHFPVARCLASQYGAKLIFEVRDLWPLSLVQLAGVTSWHPLVKILGAIEKKAYRQSDHVVSLLSNAKDYMEQKGMAAQKFVHIPNGISTDITGAPLPEAMQQVIDEHQGKFLLGYAGSLGLPNAMDQLFAALALLKKLDRLCVLIVGEGAERLSLENLAKFYGLSNVIFFPPVTRAECFTFLQSMDGLFLAWQDKSIYQFGISPNKIFDYMLAKKPILHASNAHGDPIAAANAGICAPPEQPQLLAEALEKMLQLSVDARDAMAERGLRYVKQHHCYANLARAYVKLFKPMDVEQ